MRKLLRDAVGIASLSHPLVPCRPQERHTGILGLALTMLLASGQPLLAHDYRSGDIEIVHPSSRATPAGARVAAGYATIHNRGADADRLIAVTGEIAGRVEIHEMTVNDKGSMTMRPLAGGIAIPPGGTAELKPGALHIMFMDLGRAASEDERFKGSFTFEKAGRIDVEFAVEGMGGAAAQDGQGGHGSHGSHGD